MKRIGILTAGGDTPALNATIYGAVARANQARVEVLGLIKGFASLFDPRLSHVYLNPLFQTIPELDPTVGGTLLGASREYLSGDDPRVVEEIAGRLRRLGIDGLICIGGDGTMNGMQPLADHLPVVLAPKTIDNDLGLNHRDEPNEWQRVPADQPPGYRYQRLPSHTEFDLEQMVNYVTPGFATAVFVAASGVERVRTTAESHRRIAIVEVMGRHSGYIALGAAFGQPDIILVPEYRVDLDRLVDRIRQLYDLQDNVVIVCGEGIVDAQGRELASEYTSTDPAGNKILSGAAETLRQLLMEKLGDGYFKDAGRGQFAREAIFTRKIGHTQRGGRPLLFDRYAAVQLGGKAVELLLEGQSNAVAILQWNRERGFYLDSFPGNGLRDRWGHIHARQLHPTFYDPQRLKPSRTGVEYLLPIFRNAIGADDVEYTRQTLFAPRKLLEPYHSLNTDIHKRIRYLETTGL